MAQYLKGGSSNAGSSQVSQSPALELEKESQEQLKQKQNAGRAQKSKKQNKLPQFAANISSEEDDYNFFDEGDDDMNEKSIAT